MNRMVTKEENRFKVVLIGDRDVGKYELLSCLCRFYNGERDNIDVVDRCVYFQGKRVSLQIWNCSSGERFYRLSKMYTKGASGAIVVYDVTCRNSFERLHRCFDILDPETIIILLGNKFHKTGLREVTKEEGETLASRKGYKFIELDAINEVNVDEVFTILAGDILLRREQESFMKLMTSDDTLDNSMANSVKTGIRLLENTPQIGPKYSLENSTVNKILRFGVEENYRIRVMLVGNEGVGKSTLLRRLLRKPVNINKYESTNGIDVHVHGADVDIFTGKWCVNETHTAGTSVIAKLWGYLSDASNSLLTNVAIAEQSRFHVRVAKMLTNIHLLTRKTIENSRGSVSVQMEKYSNLELVDENNEITNDGAIFKGVPKADTIKDAVDNDNAVFPAVHSSIDYDDIDKIITQAKSLVVLKENPKARVSFYDFAGQLVFHASHPTFLSSKAIYIATFDLSKVHSEKGVRTVDDGLMTNSVAMDSILFWLNIVYMFAASQSYIYPHVILVGTHADKLPKRSRGHFADMCFREIRSFLADSPLKHILSDKEFVVDNTKKADACFTEILAEIYNLAQIQPYWGEQSPSRWLPLEQAIQHAKDSGLKVVSLAEIRELNRRLEIQIPDETELQMFLEFLHDTGELIYFNEATLSEFVVLDSAWLVDALKALITADRFGIRSPNHAEKWKRFCETGIIQKTTIVAIFKANTDNPALLENSEHVLKLMEKFLFIASPINISCDLEDNGDMHKKEDVIYIVPSMVKTQSNKQLIASLEGLSRTTVFCMVSKNNFLPSAVFHKLLAKCISKWQIVEQSGQRQIFCDVCRFNLDKQKHLKLTIASVQHAIHARIISYIDTSNPQPELCKHAYIFLIEALRNILTSMGVLDEFRICIQCPRFSPIFSGGYLDIDLMDNQEYVTCDECQTSHVMQTTNLIDCWTDKGPIISNNDSVTHMQNPSENTENGDHANEEPNNTTKENDIDQCLFDVAITQAHLNHARVCNALVTVCADGLRDILLSQIPPGYLDFYGLLHARMPALMAMRNLRLEQLDTLFPDPRGRFTGTIDQFDISLLYTLIRNISSVPPPLTGWGNAPLDNPRDTSLGAATERIRICRNCVSGHSVDGRLDDQSFEHYWKDICLMMDDIEQSLGTKGNQDALKKRKDQILSPAEAQSLRTMFNAFQADVLAAVDLIMEAMGKLKTRAEDLI